MRFLLNSILALTLLCATHAQAEPSPLGLRLEEGASYQWMTVSERHTDSPKGQQRSTTTTPISLSVLKQMPDATLVALKYGKSELSSSPEHPEMQRFLGAMEEINRTLKFQILVGKNGEIQDLQNYDEIQAATGELLNKLAETSKLPAAAMPQLQAMLNSKPAVMAAFLKDVPLLFIGASINPDAEAPAKFETALPNPLGGPALKASGTAKISRPATDTGSFKLETELTTDPESISNAIAQMTSDKMSPAELQNMKQQLANMTIQDQLVANIALSTGLSNQVRFVRTTRIGDTKRIDVRTLSLTP